MKGIFKKMLPAFMACSLVGCTPQEQAPVREVAIIPAPISMEKGMGQFELNAKTSIYAQGDAAIVADYLRSDLGAAMKLPLEAADKAHHDNQIILELKPLADSSAEAYDLMVADDHIHISANKNAGLINAIATLQQLLPDALELDSVPADVAWTVPAVSISDAPRFAWRGMHLDVSRHFFTVAEVKQFLDNMALYKLNRFHWHLTDDQGWRIEIKQYPELTAKGAFRSFNNHDKVCIQKAGKEANMAIPEAHITEQDGEKIYGGYYTQEDIKDILAYAKARNIEVIPEIDMPGHFKAAIDNYPEVSCFGAAGWGKTFSSPLCPGREEAFTLVENILDEVIELFPNQYVHIGADEVEKSNWKKCKKCQARIKKEGLHDEHELQAYFVHRVERYINSKGKKMMGWDEILEGGMSKTATMMFWRGWMPNAPLEAVTQGNDVVMSPTSHCYFDYQQGASTVEHLYGFDPVGDDIPADKVKHILGGQGNVWTEYIPSKARLDYMSMPRILALSEALWTPKAAKNYDDFALRLEQHYARLDKKGVAYRLPDITGLYEQHVFIDTDTVKLECASKSVEIRYTTDGSEPTAQSALYEGPVAVSESCTFKAGTFSPITGSGGDIITASFVKSNYLKASALETAPGLKVRYYEGSGWKNTADIGIVDKLKHSGEIADFRLPEQAVKKKTSYALVYEGYIEVAESGVSTFALLCDDAGVLRIDGEMVVDNDGRHAPKRKIGQVALEKGLHKIRVDYVEAGGGGVLDLKMLNAAGKFVHIPAEVLSQKM